MKLAVTPNRLAVLPLLVLLVSCGSSTEEVDQTGPSPDNAWSAAKGFAISEMYARDPANFYCGGEGPGSTWYRIQVDQVDDLTYLVLGATKAIDEYCVYNVSYFSASVEYHPDAEYSWEEWDLVEPVDFTNRCVVVDASRENCTTWKHDWEPDMNWRP